MDLAGGMIRHHRIYWGWIGVGQLVRSALSRQARDREQAAAAGRPEGDR
jgi:hypothetical protein